nr:proline hydroxylase buaE-like isoform X4 [Procambarus clarkii]
MSGSTAGRRPGEYKDHSTLQVWNGRRSPARRCGRGWRSSCIKPSRTSAALISPTTVFPTTRDEGTEELHESFIVETAEDVFPDADVPSFRSSVLSVLDSCRVLSSRLLTALAISLGKDPDYFQLLHQGMGTRDSPSCLRINYYPPLPRNLTEETTRFVAHVDFSTITLLFQADTGGLQVRGRGTAWVDAHPVPSAVLLLAGEFLKSYSDDKFIAPEHQVVIPTEEHGRRSSRTSVGYFAHADNHVPMKPAGSSSPSRSDPSLTVQEYFNGFVHKRLQI